MKLAQRLDSLLMVLKSCSGNSCIHPWKVLFPGEEVTTLKQALDGKYDAFFEMSSRDAPVSFDRCIWGHINEFEGVQEPVVYNERE